jgi:hypothetical protein
MKTPSMEARCGEWLGIFENISQNLIKTFRTTREFIPTINGVLQQEIEVPNGAHVYKVGVHSELL